MGENNQPPYEARWVHRDLYSTILVRLPERFILSILGLRRLGKSTLMRQLIARLLQQLYSCFSKFYKCSFSICSKKEMMS